LPHDGKQATPGDCGVNMSIAIQYSGRLGNNMFQYAFARLMQETRGGELYEVSGAFKFAEHFPNVLKCKPRPNEKYEIMDETRDFESFKGKVMRLHPSINVELHGYFQNWEYFRGSEWLLRTWFRLPAIDFRPDKNDIVMHIRRDDYLEAKSALDFQYYDLILCNFYRKIYITGEIDKETELHFSKYPNIEYIYKNEIETLQFIKTFQNIAISNSTFAWWGAMLSDAQNIYCPKPITGYWSDEQTQRLFVPDRMIQIGNIGVNK
jgi:hypothetical protein